MLYIPSKFQTSRYFTQTESNTTDINSKQVWFTLSKVTFGINSNLQGPVFAFGVMLSIEMVSLVIFYISVIVNKSNEKTDFQQVILLTSIVCVSNPDLLIYCISYLLISSFVAMDMDTLVFFKINPTCTPPCCQKHSLEHQIWINLPLKMSLTNETIFSSLGYVCYSEHLFYDILIWHVWPEDSSLQ